MCAFAPVKSCKLIRRLAVTRCVWKSSRGDASAAAGGAWRIDVVDDGAQHLGRQRLLQKIDRPQLHGANGVGNVAIGGDDHDGSVEMSVPPHFRQQADAVHLRQPQVENREVEVIGRERFERLGRVAGLRCLPALGFQRDPVAEADVGFVVNKKYAFVITGFGSLSVCRGQIEIEFASLAGGAVDTDRSAVRGHDFLCDGQGPARSGISLPGTG